MKSQTATNEGKRQEVIAVPCSKIGVQAYHGEVKNPEKLRFKPLKEISNK
jgi:hypothetical protein